MAFSLRRLPLYAVTAFVALILVYSFVAPFQGALDGNAAGGVVGEDVPVAEDFELPAEMQPGGEQDPQQPASPEPAEAAPPASSQGTAAPLERVEPRPPLSDIGQAAAPAPPPEAVAVDDSARPKLLYRPVAGTAGEIEASGYRISLAGIDPPALDETCAAEGGGGWPCGMAARTALRNWLRSRAVECVVPEQPPGEAIATRCKLGTTDVSQWLVTNGWARAEGDELAELMNKAQEERRGIFGAAPAAPASNDVPLPRSDVAPPGLTPSDIAPPGLTSPDAPFDAPPDPPGDIAPPPLSAPDAPFPPAPQ
ncbi:thermonuclease family protein [Phyllobacterium sp. 0TCS1.6A]|nr:thermonuclease family protein [Phyllobacterium sp. 0TCS1.6A]MCX8295463.1 thermonuclease family protein [Phyllobacterium sp. 0TCS1.6A]